MGQRHRQRVQHQNDALPIAESHHGTTEDTEKTGKQAKRSDESECGNLPNASRLRNLCSSALVASSLHFRVFRLTIMSSPLYIGPLVVDPPLLQAPMAGFTNYAYRQVVRRFGGVGLPATEMLSARIVRTYRRVTGRRMAAERKRDSPIVTGARIGTVPARRRLSRAALGRGRRAAAAGGADLGQRSRDAGRGRPAAGRGVSRQRGGHQFRLPGPRRFGKGRKAARICCAIPSGSARSSAAVAAACRPVPVTAKIRLGCHPRHDQRHRRGPGDRSRPAGRR